ncbi:unnamed protein product [Clonostachys solani]|uniref:Uncharacterized protein n=1 Tax=Clonostachys solani TaxID=160281 RepID=A0A9N9ZL26_9HYPO|nr:unnamed protein product [Clonostachys solani]
MEVFSLQIDKKLWNVATSVSRVPSSSLRCAYLARAHAPTMAFQSQRSCAAGSPTSWIASRRSCARKSIILLSTRHSIGSPAFQIPRMQSRYSSEVVAIPPHEEMNTSCPSSFWRRGIALTCELTSAKASFEAAPLIQIQPGSLASCSGLSDGRADAEAVSILREVTTEEASTEPKALSFKDAWKKGMNSMDFMIMSMLPMPCRDQLGEVCPPAPFDVAEELFAAHDAALDAVQYAAGAVLFAVSRLRVASPHAGGRRNLLDEVSIRKLLIV